MRRHLPRVDFLILKPNFFKIAEIAAARREDRPSKMFLPSLNQSFSLLLQCRGARISKNFHLAINLRFSARQIPPFSRVPQNPPYRISRRPKLNSGPKLSEHFLSPPRHQSPSHSRCAELSRGERSSAQPEDGTSVRTLMGPREDALSSTPFSREG